MSQNIYKYVCEKSPEESVALARQFSSSVKNEADALRVMLAVMNSSNTDAKIKLLESIREIHPDKDLFIDYASMKAPLDFEIPDNLASPEKRFNTIYRTDPKPKKKDIKEESHSACGCSNCAKKYSATGDASITPLSTPDSNYTISSLLNDRIFKVIVSICVILILYKLFIKPSVSR